MQLQDERTGAGITLEVSLLTSLKVEFAICRDLSLDYRQEHIHRTSLCGGLGSFKYGGCVSRATIQKRASQAKVCTAI